MGIFKYLANLFTASSSPNVYLVTVKCNRCGETIQARINLQNDLSVDFEGGGKPTYHCRKTLMGEGHCFERLEVELTFDESKRLVSREISGGQFIDSQ